MISTLIWAAAGALIFLSNHFHWTTYIGVRFTVELIGIPISGGWLCAVVSLYCLIRFFVRRSRKDKEAGQGAE